MDSIRKRASNRRKQELEEVVIAMLDGKGGNYPDEAFNPIWLSRGFEIEMEHTSYPLIAKIIAKQHLTENPNYYFWLIRMEKEMNS